MVKHLFLVGMPGAGKTYWGRLLASQYSFPFVDLDEYIEVQENATIPTLFKEHGADYFRAVEQRCLRKLVGSLEDPHIIACGGGTPCFYENMTFMKHHGVTIYLEESVTTLMTRLQGERAKRPLLEQSLDMEQEFTALLLQRGEYYQQAHYKLVTDNLSTITFGEIIKACINQP